MSEYARIHLGFLVSSVLHTIDPKCIRAYSDKIIVIVLDDAQNAYKKDSFWSNLFKDTNYWSDDAFKNIIKFPIYATYSASLDQSRVVFSVHKIHLSEEECLRE